MTEPTPPLPLNADLVLESGGVKGVAFAGAVEVLAQAGYSFPRIAGTSAGAIAGSILAALQHAGEPATRLLEILGPLDVSTLLDEGAVGRLFGPLHDIADVGSLLVDGGLHPGRALHGWISGTLADLGIRTFGDLRRTDPGSALPPAYEYSFVAVTSDISQRRMSLLPWDYAHYGLDPDEQPVADAVTASACIPLLFEPRHLTSKGGDIRLVDGGLLSQYPITIFDQPSQERVRWPTLGIRLSARETDRPIVHSTRPPFELMVALVETMMNGWDARHIEDAGSAARTIFVDTGFVSSLNFDLSAAEKAKLIAVGRQAATAFLATWDAAAWVARYAGRPTWSRSR